MGAMNSEPDYLEALAQFAGMPEADLADEHVRWQAYSRVLPLLAARDSLRVALSVEPVRSLASAVVVEMFGHLSPGDRAAWVDLLPPESRAVPAQRMAELEIIDRYQTRPHETTATDVTAWSDWLQRQIVSTTFAPAVLGELAAEGRTKRIRAIAARRLAAVRTETAARADATFRALVEAIIETADASVGVEVLEPGLERTLQLVRQNPDQRPQFETELISLLSPSKQA